MKNKKKLENLINKNNGTVLSSDLDKYDIPRVYLQMMVAEGRLERMNRGIYSAVDSIEDEMYALQKKYSKLIYSHETALFIHGLSDRTPFVYAASVPSGYKVVPNISEKFKIYYIKNALHQMGVKETQSTFGNLIKVYNLERTICDIVRSRNRIDIQILNDALKRYVRLRSADFSLLMHYAKQLKIESKIKQYLEVLL